MWVIHKLLFVLFFVQVHTNSTLGGIGRKDWEHLPNNWIQRPNWIFDKGKTSVCYISFSIGVVVYNWGVCTINKRSLVWTCAPSMFHSVYWSLSLLTVNIAKQSKSGQYKIDIELSVKNSHHLTVEDLLWLSVSSLRYVKLEQNHTRHFFTGNYLSVIQWLTRNISLWRNISSNRSSITLVMYYKVSTEILPNTPEFSEISLWFRIFIYGID